MWADSLMTCLSHILGLNNQYLIGPLILNPNNFFIIKSINERASRTVHTKLIADSEQNYFLD